MNINLHIERLVLDGLPVSRRDASRIQTAVESELVRLLTAGEITGLLQSGGALPSLRANTVISLGANTNTDTIGQQIARSVYGSISND